MKEFKKYIIGFLIGLLGVGAVSYAADNGSIGALFKVSGGSWVLMGDNIEDGTIDSSEIEDGTIDVLDIKDNSITSDISEWSTIGNTCSGLVCIAYCLNGTDNIVGMKWIEKDSNYDECISLEGGSKIKLITYYK